MALSGVSRKFRSLVFPQLFDVLSIKSYDEIFLWDLESHPYFAHDMITRVPKVLTTVKELRFSAPFEHTDLEGCEDMKRCPHSFTPNSSASSIDSPRSEDDLPISQEDDGAVMRKREDAKYMGELFDSEYGDVGLMKLATKIARLLSALPDNQLTSFR